MNQSQSTTTTKSREGLVQCYHCGLLLSLWEFIDLPMVEHIRHFPTCDFLKSRYGQSVVDQFATEYHVQLDKVHDFLNIEGRPTFNQYLSWANYMKRLGVTFMIQDAKNYLR